MVQTLESLNKQLSNAVVAIAAANERLARMRLLTESARREETLALQSVNDVQKYFDDLVATVKKGALRGTDWRVHAFDNADYTKTTSGEENGSR